jgi:hypothetical protein
MLSVDKTYQRSKQHSPHSRQRLQQCIAERINWTEPMTDTVTDRFLRYVVIDSQSDPDSSTQAIHGKAEEPGPLAG